ncbi:MAG: S4 domain-containing protein [Terracidiphilus sp.]
MAKEALNKKERIDVVLVQRGLVPSRERARALILAGRVLVNEQKVDNRGARLP